MNVNQAQNLIKKAILSGNQIKIGYTNSKGVSDEYLILNITSAWKESFNTVAESVSKGKTKPFNKFRYDRISSIEITEESFYPNDNLLDQIRTGGLFADVDDRVMRRGGLKGYRSSADFVSSQPRRLKKEQAEDLLQSLDLPAKSGWERGVMVHIEDGDTFDILLENDSKGVYVSRLLGVDAPETSGDVEETALGWEAKVLVEEMFEESRFCYVRKYETDSYRRHLVDVQNARGEDIGITLLENGLGLPMMGYLDSEDRKNAYLKVTTRARDEKIGIWSIDEVRSRFSTIVSDQATLGDLDVLGFIPDKKSALNKYLKENPKSNITHQSIYRCQRNEIRERTAFDIFQRMVEGLDPHAYDLDGFKRMCDIYVEEITLRGKVADNEEEVRDLILHIEEFVDALKLGEGEVLGNFSKFKTKLVYHDNPDDHWYKLCIPEIRFRTVDDAKYCGFEKRK